MSQIDLEALKPIGAAASRIRALDVTTSSQNVDLSTLAEFGSGTHLARILRLRADGTDVYYAFYKDNSLTIDGAQKTAGNNAQCDVIPAGQYIDVCIPYVGAAPTGVSLWSFLYWRGVSTGSLRVSVVSEDPVARMS